MNSSALSKLEEDVEIIRDSFSSGFISSEIIKYYGHNKCKISFILRPIIISPAKYYYGRMCFYGVYGHILNVIFPLRESNLQNCIKGIIKAMNKSDFDRLLKMNICGGSTKLINDLQWLSPFGMDSFTGLIQFSYYQFCNCNAYRMVCDLISKDRFISVSIGFLDTIQSDIDLDILSNALKSTNALKCIRILRKHVNITMVEKRNFKIEWRKMLQQALQINFSVTELISYGTTEITFKPRTLYGWWPAIKKRNESLQPWNNNLCPAKIAKQILDMHLNLPSSFFDVKGDKCFCNKCHKEGSRIVYSRGKPSKKYVLPVGWTRLGLKVNEGLCVMNKVFDEWHVSFHGTSKERVVIIFRGGLSLLKAGDIALGGTKLEIKTGHISKAFSRLNKYTNKREMFDPNQIFTSCSMKYAGHGAYAAPFSCSHPDDGSRTLKVQFAFQCRQRPGSYGIGQKTVGGCKDGKKLDVHFDNNELEWYTKENAGIVLHGLLMKIREVTVNKRADRIIIDMTHEVEQI